MFSFKDKKWWKSKTFWTAVIMGGVAVAKGLGVDIDGDLFTGILGLLGAFGLYTMRDAVGKSGPGE